MRPLSSHRRFAAPVSLHEISIGPSARLGSQQASPRLLASTFTSSNSSLAGRFSAELRAGRNIETDTAHLGDLGDLGDLGARRMMRLDCISSAPACVTDIANCAERESEPHGARTRTGSGRVSGCRRRRGRHSKRSCRNHRDRMKSPSVSLRPRLGTAQVRRCAQDPRDRDRAGPTMACSKSGTMERCDVRVGSRCSTCSGRRRR